LFTVQFCQSFDCYRHACLFFWTVRKTKERRSNKATFRLESLMISVSNKELARASTLF